MAAAGIIADGFGAALEGLGRLQAHPARLINDFVAVVGIGGTLVNAALVGAVGLAAVALSGVAHSGPTFAAVLTMTGFGLFGKTPLNVLPIILGVYLAARIAGKGLKDYLIIALFGTALGPLVSALAVEIGLDGLLAVLVGTAGGIITGMVLPAVAVSMLHLHQGYNLYNMGLSCGFFGLFAAGLFRAFGHAWEAQAAWFTGSSLLLTLVAPVLSLLLLAAGVAAGGRSSFGRFVAIQKLPGRLPSDFVDMTTLGGALVNAGLVGIAGSAYVLAVGAPFNGPVLGGLFTIIGFAAFGTHLRNSWPVVAGVVIACLVTGNPLNAPGPILAAIFCTTLAPLAGQFGILVGLAAGFMHLVMVLTTGSWHGAMNLYNNGFAGGLTAALIIAVIQWIRSNQSEK